MTEEKPKEKEEQKWKFCPFYRGCFPVTNLIKGKKKK